MSGGQAKYVPKSRFARSAALGGTATKILGSAALGSVSKLTQGERPDFQSLLVTPANIKRLTNQLARMRGAAMKLGQLLSMDAGDVLPQEITDIMARLRSDADFMPPKQLKQVLNAQWGDGWLQKFKRFDVRPIAAASIGQVHHVVTKDGRDLALKVQYPGVRQSIDSDVTNVGSLIKLSGLLPTEFDLDPLLDQAKAQLHDEANYLREAQHLSRYAERLKGNPNFLVPSLEEEFSTETILAMDFIKGRSIEEATALDQHARNGLIERLLELTLREVFEWQHMQTDPNFANYLLHPESGALILLDFGAATDLPHWVAEGYRSLLRSGINRDKKAINNHALELGFIANDAPPNENELIIDMIAFSCTQLSQDSVFDFSDNGPAIEMRERGQLFAQQMTLMHVPPIETLLVQRKLAGMYLLARKLGAKVNLHRVLSKYL